MKSSLRLIAPLTLSLLLAACGSQPERPSSSSTSAPATSPSRPATSQPPVATPRGGGYYKDDGPASEIPDNLDQTPDAVPRWEPLHKPALRPYEVFGKRYVPNTSIRPYKARGLASWYGKKFHGQKTSIGERYDMFAMTAAHPTLALPSYARVTNLNNGRSVVVRVIDRGPFHAGRIVDLSYTAAHKLDIIRNGSAQVEVEAIIPDSSSTSYAQLAPPAEPANPPRVESILPRGVYLQLGAFSNADNADNLKRHLTGELDWVREEMHIVRAGGLHRLQLGPYSSRPAAEDVAERIRNALGFKPGIVVR
jgi:rare lipoprotein A